MGRTACTEPQCLYSRAIPLLPLWAVRPVQSLSACTRVHFTFTILPTSFGHNDHHQAISQNRIVQNLQFVCDPIYIYINDYWIIDSFKIINSFNPYSANVEYMLSS
jgi:hypothetical protein